MKGTINTQEESERYCYGYDWADEKNIIASFRTAICKETLDNYNGNWKVYIAPFQYGEYLISRPAREWAEWFFGVDNIIPDKTLEYGVAVLERMDGTRLEIRNI